MQVVYKNGKVMGVRQQGRYYDTETVKEMRKAGYSVREIKAPEEKQRRKPKDGS